jgi:hypothetical protein
LSEVWGKSTNFAFGFHLNEIVELVAADVLGGGADRLQ